MTTYLDSPTDLLQIDDRTQDLLFRQARTANTFTDEPVTDEQVRAIYELVKWAPTSMNTQPMRVTLLRSDEARARLLQHMSPGNRDKTGAAPLVAIFSADTDFHELLPRTFPHFPGAKDMFADDEARHGAARANATLQTAYLILGVRAAGLAAGPMWGYDGDGIDRDFIAGTPQHVVAVLNIGRPGPDAWFGRSPRLDFEDVVTTL